MSAPCPRRTKDDMRLTVMNEIRERTVYYWFKQRCFIRLARRDGEAMYVYTSHCGIWALPLDCADTVMIRASRRGATCFFKAFDKYMQAHWERVRTLALEKLHAGRGGIKLQGTGEAAQSLLESGERVSTTVLRYYHELPDTRRAQIKELLQSLITGYSEYTNTPYAETHVNITDEDRVLRIKMRTNKNELRNDKGAVNGIALLMYNAFVKAKMTAEYHVIDVPGKPGIVDEEVILPMYIEVLAMRMEDALRGIYSTAENTRAEANSDGQNSGAGDDGRGLVAMCS